jgi:hypothetical protein
VRWVWSAECGVWSAECDVWSVECRLVGVRCRAWSDVSRVQGLGSARGLGSEFRVHGEGLGFRDLDL